MDEALEAIDPLFADKVRIARAMTPQQRLRAGFVMTEYLHRTYKAKIRDENPTASEDEISAIFQERIRLERVLERMPHPDTFNSPAPSAPPTPSDLSPPRASA